MSNNKNNNNNNYNNNNNVFCYRYYVSFGRGGEGVVELGANQPLSIMDDHSGYGPRLSG